MMIIGHRGASGSAPENTMAAFRKAVQDGAGWLELDVRPSKDGEVVVFHDERLRRTTHARGKVQTHTLAELKRLDAGSFFDRRFAGERIPTLQEVVVFAKTRRTGLFIEMKPGPHLGHGFEEKVVATLVRDEMLERSFVMSFNHPATRRVKELEPTLKTLLVVEYRTSLRRLLHRVREYQANGVSVRAALATKALVRALHADGLILVVWTVNSPRQMRRFIAKGVDGITTDFPSRLVNLQP